MDEKFHYQCIRVLAQRAGLNAADAETVAYASQYTDHATEHKPIHVVGLPPEATPQTVRETFDPVCTAHEALQYVTQWRSKAAQRKVYISFHFVPPAPFSAQAEFQFVVEPDSVIARALVTDAVAALGATAADTTERTRQLIRLGIALHSYADTWAHQGFSGRWSPTDNDVQDRQVFEQGQWNRLDVSTRIALDVAPDVGHAECATMPDKTYLRFRYRKASNSRPVERDNPSEFLKAAKAIYGWLCGHTGKPTDWDGLGPSLEQCFRDPGQWESVFADVLQHGGYDRLAWRRAALVGERYDWDRMSDPAEFAELHYTAGSDLKWFLFHVEAGKQRDRVLTSIAGASL